MSVKKKRTIGPCRGVTWLYYVVLLWLRDFFLSLYLDPRFRPLLLKYTYILHIVGKFHDREHVSFFSSPEPDVCPGGLEAQTDEGLARLLQVPVDHSPPRL